MASVELAKELLKTRSVWVVLVLVVAIELWVRVALPAGKIPKGAFHSSEFRQQVEQYSQNLPVDMLIVGSSVAAVNYPPVPLDASIRALDEHPEFTTFNAGIRGCNYQCIAVGMRQHYLSQYLPPIVLLVLDPADLNQDNQTVVGRSLTFSSDMTRGLVSRAGRNIVSDVSKIYGFKEELRDWLTSGGQWSFDSATLGVRGYVDMGSQERQRIQDVPLITHQSALTQGFVDLVSYLAQAGTKVILLPVEGDSLAQSLLGKESREQIRRLLDASTEHPNVYELGNYKPGFTDEDYIDTLHLSTQAAALNSQRLGEALMQSGLLSDL